MKYYRAYLIQKICIYVDLGNLNSVVQGLIMLLFKNNKDLDIIYIYLILQCSRTLWDHPRTDPFPHILCIRSSLKYIDNSI